MRLMDKIILSQIVPWQPNKKIYKIEEIIFWNLVKFTPMRVINFFFNMYVNTPYLKQNEDYQCIYIHIPKNAGITIQEILFPNYSNAGHKSLLYYKLYDEKKFNKYFKFAFVRNPWDRVVSAYHFLIKGGLNSNEPGAQRWSENLKNFGIESFESFVLSIENPYFSKCFLNHRHLRPQHHWITDENGNLALDFIGKIENFDTDMEKLKKILGLHTNFTANNHIKRNVTNHENYKKLYNERMKEIVEKFYKKDIELFNYNFEQAE